MIEYLDKVIKSLALMMPKMSRYIITFKAKDGRKDKNIKLMSFSINDEKLLKNIKLFGLKLKT